MMEINGINKNWARLVMCYGLNENEIEVVRKNLPVKDCEIFNTDCFTDIIAMPQMVAIARWDSMLQQDKETFEELYTEMGPFPETIIIIGMPDVNADLKKQLIVYENFDNLAVNIKYKLLNAYKKTKKSENFSSTLSNALIILREIKQKPYITTKELADKLEISTRSVQRYITTLVVAGEWIEYDRGHKGWIFGPLDLLDDF